MVLPIEAVTALAGTIVGAVAGGGVGYYLSVRLDDRRRELEGKDVAVVIYAEIADRVGRCLNDYIFPWTMPREEMNRIEAIPIAEWRGDIAKFMPQKLVVYRELASRLALIDVDAQTALTSFDYAHHAWGRDLSEYIREAEQVGPALMRVRHLIDYRMTPVLTRGLRVLDLLARTVGREKARDIERAVVENFDHIPSDLDDNTPLRAALEQATRAAPDPEVAQPNP